jgi:hypothetical protein
MNRVTGFAALRLAVVVVLLEGCLGGGGASTGPIIPPSPSPSTSAELSRWTVVQDVVAFSDPAGPLEIRAIEPWGPAAIVAVGAGPRGAVAWQSPDGVSWRRIPDSDVFHTPGGAAMVALAASGGDLVAVGIGDSATLAAVWVSNDGETWRRTFESSAEEYGGGMASVASTDATSVAVGIGLPDPNVEEWVGAAWTSPDGTAWTPVVDMLAVSPRALFDVAPAGPGFVAVGGIGGSVAVSSVDGRRWTTAELPPGPPPDTELRSMAVDGSGRIIAVGSAAGWMLSSADGASWTWIQCADPEPGPAFTAIAAGPKGFIAVGSDAVGPVLWRSNDGATWESVSDFGLPVGASIKAVGSGLGRAVLAVTNVDGSSAVWVGPEDGRGEHPARRVACTAS